MFNPKWLIGKTIKSVTLERHKDEDGLTQNNLQTIHFTDGSSLSFSAYQSTIDHYVEPHYRKAKK